MIASINNKMQIILKLILRIFTILIMDSLEVEQAQLWLESWVQCGSIPGALLSIFDSNGRQLFYHESSSTNNADKYDASSIFRVYSMTKPVTCFALMILVDRGIISVDDEVGKWIPSFHKCSVLTGGTIDEPLTEPLKEPMKIYHLLTHTSGISYGIFSNSLGDQLLCRNFGASNVKVWCETLSLSDLCDAIAKTPLCFQPGSKFLYGWSIDVVGHILEIASGLTLDEFFKKEIFEPLEMNDTEFYLDETKISRLVNCYEKFGPTYRLSSNCERDRSKPKRLLGGGMSLVSTITDYEKFSRCLLNKGVYKGLRIVSEDVLNKMLTSQLPGNVEISHMAFDSSFSELLGDGYGFGYGGYVLQNPSRGFGESLSGVGCYGWGGVASTFFFIDPVYKISVIFMTQLIPSNAYPIRPQIRWITHKLLQPLINQAEKTCV